MDYSSLKKKRTNAGAVILSMAAVFFIFVGGCFVLVAFQSSSTSKSYEVCNDVVIGKREEITRSTGSTNSKTSYYLDLQYLGEKKVNSGKYEACSEDEPVILVLDMTGRVQKIYSGNEYVYVGEKDYTGR